MIGSYRGAVAAESIHAVLEFVKIEVQAVGNVAEVILRQVFTRKNQTEGGVVVNDHPAIAVEDLSARRQHRQRLNPVAFGLLAVNVRVAHLEIPESGEKKNENPDGDVLKEGDLTGRPLHGFPYRLSGRHLLAFFFQVATWLSTAARRATVRAVSPVHFLPTSLLL